MASENANKSVDDLKKNSYTPPKSIRPKTSENDQSKNTNSSQNKEKN